MSRRPDITIGRRPGFRGFGGDSRYDYRTSLGTLVAAWDFALGVTEVSGAVDSILDQSGRGNTLGAPAAANRPAYTASDADFNNQPSATGDGTDDFLRDTAIDMGAAFAPGTIIVVAKIVSAGASEPLFSMNVNSTLVRDTGTGTIQAIQGSGGKSTTTGFTAQAHVFGMVADGSTIQLYVDGVAEGTTAAYTGTTADGSAVSLFARSDGAAPENCKIAFASISLTALSPAQMADFATYARARWGTP